jgi:hypothetical protein
MVIRITCYSLSRIRRWMWTPRFFGDTLQRGLTLRRNVKDSQCWQICPTVTHLERTAAPPNKVILVAVMMMRRRVRARRLMATHPKQQVIYDLELYASYCMSSLECKCHCNYVFTLSLMSLQESRDASRSAASRISCRLRGYQ